jgi:prevent-host-death family protein
VKEVTVRDLRNNGGEVLDAVMRGEGMTVTRQGRAIAELRPLRGPGVRIETLERVFKGCPTFDYRGLVDDMGEILDLSL